MGQIMSAKLKGDKLIVHLAYDTYDFMSQMDTEKDTKQEINHPWSMFFLATRVSTQ